MQAKVAFEKQVTSAFWLSIQPTYTVCLLLLMSILCTLLLSDFLEVCMFICLLQNFLHVCFIFSLLNLSSLPSVYLFQSYFSVHMSFSTVFMSFQSSVCFSSVYFSLLSFVCFFFLFLSVLPSVCLSVIPCVSMSFLLSVKPSFCMLVLPSSNYSSFRLSVIHVKSFNLYLILTFYLPYAMLL